MKHLYKLKLAIYGIPRTLWFNLIYLPFNQAIRFPFLLSSKVKIRNCYRGGVILTNKRNKFARIRIGFHCVGSCDNYRDHTILDISKGGQWIIKDDAHIGIGAIIHIEGGIMRTGSNFAVSGSTTFECKDSIIIGNDVQFSYNGHVIDSDAHYIIDENGEKNINHAPIIIGSKVWVAPNSIILKGSSIANNTIISSNSLINKKFEEESVVLGGVPARLLKRIKGWEI